MAFLLGDIFQRNVNIRSGQAPVIHYMPYLYNLIADGKVDPGDVVTHVLPLDQAKHGYEIFDTKTDNCIKVVLKPLNDINNVRIWNKYRQILTLFSLLHFIAPFRYSPLRWYANIFR